MHSALALVARGNTADENVISASDAIAAIIMAEGDLHLAAEYLFGVHDPNSGLPPPKARLIQIISEDPRTFGELQRSLRTLTLLQAFNTTRLTGVVVDSRLDELEDHDRTKLYVQLVTQLQSLTDEHTSTVNTNSTHLDINDALLRSLPPEAREAVKILMMAPGHNSDDNNTEAAVDDGRDVYVGEAREVSLSDADTPRRKVA